MDIATRKGTKGRVTTDKRLGRIRIDVRAKWGSALVSLDRFPPSDLERLALFMSEALVRFAEVVELKAAANPTAEGPARARPTKH